MAAVMAVTLAARAVSVCPFCPLCAAPWAILTCVMGLKIMGFSPSALCLPRLLISWLSDSCCRTSAPDTRQWGGFSRFSLVRMCVQVWDPCSLWARDSLCRLFGCIPAPLVDPRSEASACALENPEGCGRLAQVLAPWGRATCGWLDGQILIEVCSAQWYKETEEKSVAES